MMPISTVLAGAAVLAAALLLFAFFRHLPATWR